MANELMLGADVLAKDGGKIGLLNHVRGDYLRIQGPGVESFWLSADVVQSSDPIGVHLSFASDALDEYKLTEDDLPQDLETESPINPSRAPGA